MGGQRSVFVGEVDCADFTEALCGNLTRRDYPQIAYGLYETKLVPYEGGKDAASLRALAEGLLPEIAKLPPPRPRPRPEDAYKPKLSAAELKKFLSTDGMFEL